MQHEGLFNKAMAGTKLIVEKYHDTVVEALDFTCDSPISNEEVGVISAVGIILIYLIFAFLLNFLVM